ncbi:MAG: S8 family serine peptidase [Eubacterium sp.]
MKKIFYLLTMVMAVAGGSLTVRAQAVYPTAKTPTNSFAKLVAEDNVGDVYEKVTVNLDKGTVYADGEKTSLRKILHCSKKKEEQYLEKSASGFEKSVENQTVCEVEKTSASKVEITNNFQTKRIIAAVTELPQTYGAEKSAKGETAYILKYATEEETQEAYDKLVKEYGEDKIFYDRVYEADELVENPGATEAKPDVAYTRQLYVDPAKTLGLYNINQQINKSGYKQNKVTVAVLDSGLIYYTNPSCEIGRKLRDKFNTQINYVFSNAKNTRDTMGHGTMVSSVIAYNTPDNVQYGVFKVMDANNKIDDAAVYAALEQVYALDIDVVNCSFSFTLSKDEGKREEERAKHCYDSILKKLYEKGSHYLLCGRKYKRK